MVSKISQETFDSVVKENMLEFGMSLEDARVESVQQFETQGVNLGNIIKDLNFNTVTGIPLLNESIEYLKASGKPLSEADKEAICKHLDVVITECDLSVPHRVLAADLGAYEFVVKTLHEECDLDKEIQGKLLLAANAIINHQPDVFEERSLEIITRLLSAPEPRIKCDALRWLQKACVRHEMNRRLIMNRSRFVEEFSNLLRSDNAEVIKNLCALFRYIVLDDDIRVEFGMMHEHARMLSVHLTDVTQLLFKFKTNQTLISDILLTIGALTVRNEYCQVVEEAGGLKFIMDAMVEFPENVKLLREAIKLLKALAGNDSVKLRIIQGGAAPLLESALNRHKDKETFARYALLCVATLALRVQENSVALFESGISDTIIQTMKIHPKSEHVQRNGAWAIRNMVSRCRDQCDTFISQGVEDVLNQALAEHPKINQDIRSALRDLGCKVHLNEEWKGIADIKIREDS